MGGTATAIRSLVKYIVVADARSPLIPTVGAVTGKEYDTSGCVRFRVDTVHSSKISSLTGSIASG